MCDFVLQDGFELEVINAAEKNVCYSADLVCTLANVSGE
jgi:hypothetical protein